MSKGVVKAISEATPATCGVCLWCDERIVGKTGECYALPPESMVMTNFMQVDTGPRVELRRRACSLFQPKIARPA